jgi:hypothetical protein
VASCRIVIVALPDTGGMSLLLVVGVLLVVGALLFLGAGVLLYAALRRRM